MFKLVVVFMIVKCVFTDTVDIIDSDDPFSAIYHSAAHYHTSKCVASTIEGDIIGECKSVGSCLFSGGAPHGYCGLLGTCCVYEKSCGKTTNKKVSYFEGKYNNESHECNYHVKFYNPNVCQIRLDFISLKLANPLVVPFVSKCLDDVLTIEPNYYNISEICGINDNQHVYIHVNPKDQVKLNLKLKMRNEHELFLPEWKIKVTQLECPGDYGKRTDNYVFDFPRLAPLGAIQYFTEKKGNFKSFGFNNYYVAGQNYIIAFKKWPGYCGIRYLADNSFFVPCGTSADDDIKESEYYEYLSVPNLQVTLPEKTKGNLARVCGEGPANFQSTGPFYIQFMSSMYSGIDKKIKRFSIDYELLSEC